MTSQGFDVIISKIKNKKARVGVIGLGYVGLPLVIEFGKAGFSVIGLDIDKSKIDLLSSGKCYIHHISEENIKNLNSGKKFQASTDFSLVSKLDCVLICVPTPLTDNREPDMSYILSTAKEIAPYIKKNQLIILESTTYPGTTKELLAPELEIGCGLKADHDFFIAYSPEREDPNNKNFSTVTIPKVVGADHPSGLKLANALYSSVINETVPVSSTRVAEATKLMENIFRSVNIALVNELKIIFEKMGIDVWEVIEASSTKPFGFMPFYPGPGLGGHCIPIDPFYLTWKARQYGVDSRFIELAGEVNISMPTYVIEKVESGLASVGKKLSNSRILLLGLAYKKNVDDERESATFKILDLLTQRGAEVDFNDPYIPVIKPRREYKKFAGKTSVSLKYINQYDITVLLTDHSIYDYKAIVDQSKKVVDTRNACRAINSNKIIKA